VSPREVVIIGAGLAGATAAQGLRGHGFAGRLVLVGDEPERPYERPPLSKEYLLGTMAREKTYVHPQDWYAEHDVELLLSTTATFVDRGVHEVGLSDGSRLPYDALLLATGSRPRRLTVPGADLEGVHYLRQLGESDALRAAYAEATAVVVIGGGWIGLETAAAARAAGLAVTVLEAADLPLLRVLGREVAGLLADVHVGHGVDLRTGVTVAELVGRAGSVTAVRLGDGTEIPADLVVVGVGITPNDELAREAALTVGNGVSVDEHLRSSDPDVFAAGDVADAYHPWLRRSLRVEHWANARRQGAVVARSMLGQDVTYDRLPYFFSDQYDVGLEYTGYVEPDGYDEVVLRGDAAAGPFVAFWLSAGRVLAGMTVNTWDAVPAIEALIRSQAEVDTRRLGDVGVPLEDVVGLGEAVGS
jgi:3-phenylpropionate/trans-cinnamate dioxygenase ferredoxin reductase component